MVINQHLLRTSSSCCGRPPGKRGDRLFGGGFKNIPTRRPRSWLRIRALASLTGRNRGRPRSARDRLLSRREKGGRRGALSRRHTPECWNARGERPEERTGECRFRLGEIENLPLPTPRSTSLFRTASSTCPRQERSSGRSTACSNRRRMMVSDIVLERELPKNRPLGRGVHRCIAGASLKTTISHDRARGFRRCRVAARAPCRSSVVGRSDGDGIPARTRVSTASGGALAGEERTVHAIKRSRLSFRGRADVTIMNR